MEPTYHSGDRVLVRRVPAHRIRAGDVVVIEHPGEDGRWTTPASRPRADRQWLIKRVAALPGDPVPRDLAPALAVVPDERVPAGRVVVFGDAGLRSYDSKQIGFLPHKIFRHKQK